MPGAFSPSEFRRGWCFHQNRPLQIQPFVRLSADTFICDVSASGQENGHRRETSNEGISPTCAGYPDYYESQLRTNQSQVKLNPLPGSMFLRLNVQLITVIEYNPTDNRASCRSLVAGHWSHISPHTRADLRTLVSGGGQFSELLISPDLRRAMRAITRSVNWRIVSRMHRLEPPASDDPKRHREHDLEDESPIWIFGTSGIHRLEDLVKTSKDESGIFPFVGRVGGVGRVQGLWFRPHDRANDTLQKTRVCGRHRSLLIIL
ncbi:unnamed protein product, partial [Nesidiocoris tenuis]